MIELVAAKQEASDRRARARDGFINFAGRMGAGADNMLSQGTYILLNTLTRNPAKLEAMYRQSWVVGAVVDCVANDMTRAGINIKTDDAPDRVKVLNKAFAKKVMPELREALKWSRLYGGSIAFIDIDGQDPSMPLDLDTIGKGQFNGLKVFDRHQVQPDTVNIVPCGPNVGLPAFYTLLSDIATGKLTNLRMHHSRVVRLAGIPLPKRQAIAEQMWGMSVVERMFDRLLAFDSATTGAANLVHKAHLRTVLIEGLRDTLMNGGEEEAALIKQFDYIRMLQSSEGLTILDKEDDMRTDTYTFSGLDDAMLIFAQQISGATGIPLIILYGQSPRGMNATGESDTRMYYDRIKSEQEAYIDDAVEKTLGVLYRSEFGSEPPPGLQHEFVELWQMSMQEKSQIATAVTNAVNTSFAGGVISHATALKELRQSSEITGIFSNITDEEIAAADEAPPEAGLEGTPGNPLLEDPTNTLAKIQAWTQHGGPQGTMPGDSEARLAAIADWTRDGGKSNELLKKIAAYASGTAL